MSPSSEMPFFNLARYLLTLILIAVFCSDARSDIKDEGRAIRITGKLVAAGPGGVTVDAGDGKNITLAITPRARLEIVSRAAKDLLVPGAAVIAEGDLTPGGKIQKANVVIHLGRIEPGVSVFPPRSTKVAFSGMVRSLDPLVIRASQEHKVQYIVNLDNGQRTPLQHWAGKDFVIEDINGGAAGSNVGLRINLGSQIQFVEPGAYVSATVMKEPGQPVTHLYVRQDKELDAAALGGGAQAAEKDRAEKDRAEKNKAGKKKKK